MCQTRKICCKKIRRSNIHLSLFSRSFFNGRRIRISGKGLAVRNMASMDFNNQLSSFRVWNNLHPSQVTLLLFSGTNFTGRLRVFRGSQSVARLSRFNFNNVASSFIVINARLTEKQISCIRRFGVLPRVTVLNT